MVKYLTLKQLSSLYDVLYQEGERLLKRENPCKYSDGKCAGHENGCCSGCKYLTSKGCSVKSLCCKLWLCYKMHDKYYELSIELSALQNLAVQHSLSICRGSKADVMANIKLYHLYSEE